MSTVALDMDVLEGDRRGPSRGIALWTTCLALSVAVHLALGLSFLPRAPAPLVSGEDMPETSIALVPPPAASSAEKPDQAPAEAVPDRMAPEPVVEPAPDLPQPRLAAAPEPALREEMAEPPLPIVEQPADSRSLALPDVPAPMAVQADQPVPPSIAPPVTVPKLPAPRPTPVMAQPKPVMAQPKPVMAQPKSLAAPPKPAPTTPPVQARSVARLPDSAPPVPLQAFRRGPANTETRPAVAAAGATRLAARPSAATGASAASSAAWRSQLVAYLQSRLRYPSGSGSAGAAAVSFSVSRSGAVLSAGLSRSSGNPTLDAAALATVRGSVPSPPADYVGSLSFNIPIRFTQR